MLRADANHVRGRSAVRPNQDGYLLSVFQHTLRDLLNGLWFERCAAFYRHVDVRDRKFFSPHHGTSPKGYQQHTARGNNLSLRDVLVLANSTLRLSVPIAREVVLPSAKRIPL